MGLSATCGNRDCERFKATSLSLCNRCKAETDIEVLQQFVDDVKEAFVTDPQTTALMFQAHPDRLRMAELIEQIRDAHDKLAMILGTNC